ncbi:MAG: hypothetical protein Q8Q01_01790 [archaeon]|nr:hypothetical protein [archaeon]
MKIKTLLASLLIALPSVLAIQPEEAIILDPLINTFQPFFQKASLVVGGIFGLYFILILVRVHYERKKVKILKNIHSDLEKLTNHFGVPARHKDGFFNKIITSFKKKEDSPKKKKS